MGKEFYTSILLAMALSGCGNQIESICGTTGGSCCKLGGDTGYSLVCTKTAPACADLGKQFGQKAQWGYNPQKLADKNKCEMKLKSVPFYSDDPYEYLTRATPKLPLPKTFTSLEGKTVSADDPAFCQQLCLSGDVGLCPVTPLRSDTQLGLLNIIARGANDPPKSPVIITIHEVLAAFRAADDTNLCNRGDLLVAPTYALNSGPAECSVALAQVTSAGNLTATLSTPAQVLSKTLSAEGVAQWEDPKMALNLNVNDATYSKYYSGPIKYSGVIDYTDIFAEVIGSDGIGCTAVTPIEDAQYNLRDASKYIEMHPKVAGAAIDTLSKYREDLLASADSKTRTKVDAIELTTQLMPYGDYLAALSSVATDAGLKIALPSSVSGDFKDAPNLDVLLRTIDAHICNVAQTGTDLSTLMALIPEVKAGDMGPDILARREKIAGDILQCKLSAQRISKAAGEIIEAATNGKR